MILSILKRIVFWLETRKYFTSITNLELVHEFEGLSELFKDYKWTQGAIARDEKGNIVEPLSLGAEGFCLLGGIEYQIRQLPDEKEPYIEALRMKIQYCLALSILKETGINWNAQRIMANQRLLIIEYNDSPTRTKKDIQKLIKKTIKALS